MSDILLTTADGWFKYRAAGVVEDGDRLLVCAVDHIDGWFLPGGKARFGENSAGALQRELLEELGLEFSVPSDPLLVTKGILSGGGQEVCFYYGVRWPDGVAPAQVHDRDEHRFSWVRFDELTEVPFLPPQIIGLLQDRDAGLRHMAFDNR